MYIRNCFRVFDMMNADRFTHYKFGIDILDEEHWNAFSLLNDLLTWLKSGDFERADTGLETLFEYVSHHNKLEQELMEKYNYPYITRHLENNAEIIERAKKIKNHIASRKISRFDITDFESAIINHIDHHDRQLANHIHSLNSE